MIVTQLNKTIKVFKYCNNNTIRIQGRKWRKAHFWTKGSKCNEKLLKIVLKDFS